MNRTVAIASFLAVVIVISSWLAATSDWHPLRTSPDSETPDLIAAVNPDQDYILGNPEATIILIEHCDPASPYCLKFNRTINNILQRRGPTGELARVYRHMPVLTDQSVTEAQALECWVEQTDGGSFWNALNRLYQARIDSTEIQALDSSDLLAITGELGTDPEIFQTCLNSNRFESQVEQYISPVIRHGASHLPYIILELNYELPADLRPAVNAVNSQSTASIQLKSDENRIVIEGAIAPEDLNELLNLLL